VITCANCGRENPNDSRFCNTCGATLVAREAGGEERKAVTVLFADLVGFTQRAELMDPEDVRALLEPYHERVRTDLERFGGTVEKFIGDAVMALFGAPTAHEDDPERAVRAAIEIRDWVRNDRDELQLRIAVNTGEALIALDARPESGDAMASGDVVNTTARLQAAAPVNGILVGETTYRATRHAIDYAEHEPVEAKGKVDPIPVWEALEAHSRLGVDLLRRVRSPLVGRERERTLLRETLDRVKDERSSQLITLVGVPGIGKSRLVYELLDAVEQSRELTYWRQGRSLPYGEGVTYWALSEMVKAQAGVLETDSTEEAQRKLAVAVGELVGDETEAAWIASQLHPLAGITAEPEAPSDGQQSESFTAWRKFFEAMAERRRLVLVFEDIHWADDGLLDFIDHLVDWATTVPILVVCTARPELLERRPGWGGGKLNAATISLSPLSETETARLFAALLEQPVLDAETQQRLIAQAGGNPLYAEQYAQMHLERGDAGELAVPETVQGIIAARIDLLATDEKRLLQDASVLGKVFWLGGLVNGRARLDAEQYLHVLERKGFVQRARQSSVADEAEYAFRHVLVRDVAYGQIPRAARAEKHRIAADWIASLGRPDDHAEMLAHHYSSALELARAAGSPTSEFETRARTALEAAGDRAFSLNAYPAAAGFYESALELWSEKSLERGRLLYRAGRARYIAQQDAEELLTQAAELLTTLGDVETAAQSEVRLWEVQLRQGRRDDADPHLAAAFALVEGVPVSRAKTDVLMHLALSNMLAGRSKEAITYGRETFELAEQLGLDEFRAAALNISGVARTQLGDLDGINDIERAIEIAKAANSPYELARAYNNLGSMLFSLGQVVEARAATEQCIRVTDQFGLSVWRLWQRPMEAWSAYSDGDWDEALSIVEECLSEGKHHYQTPAFLLLRAAIRQARGDADGALHDADQGIKRARAARDPQAVYPALGTAAFTFGEEDEHSTASALADEYVASLVGGEVQLDGLTEAFNIAWVLRASGREGQLLSALEHATPSRFVDVARAIASGDLRAAADQFATMGLKPPEAYARLRAAEKLSAAGRRAEADEQLHAALAFYRSVGATRYVREGEALLAASA
jgi:class 3 adenylate cyclase/tetratricopeptide (TPR) repeat protein